MKADQINVNVITIGTGAENAPDTIFFDHAESAWLGLSHTSREGTQV